MITVKVTYEVDLPRDLVERLMDGTASHSDHAELTEEMLDAVRSQTPEVDYK